MMAFKYISTEMKAVQACMSCGCVLVLHLDHSSRTTVLASGDEITISADECNILMQVQNYAGRFTPISKSVYDLARLAQRLGIWIHWPVITDHIC